MLDAALQYVGRGWQIFPARFQGKEKKSYKSARHSNGRAWGKTANSSEVRRDFVKWPRAAIGIATGADSKFFVVEIDTVEGHGINGAASLQVLEAKHGALPETLMAESPTGSQHRYFNHPGGIKIKSCSLGPGIDVKGDGGMVIAPPSMRPGKGEYRWLNNATIVDAPNWLLTLVTARETTQQPSPNKNLEADIDEVIEALAVVPNNDGVDRDRWVDVGLATFAATKGEGFDVWNAWSRRYEEYNENNTVAAWKSFKPTSIGAGTLFHLAKQAWPGYRDDPHAAPTVRAFADAVWGNSSNRKVEQPAPEQKSRPPTTAANDDPLIFHGDADYESPRWLIHERIPETGVGLLAGQFGMFKTFHAIDLIGAIVAEHDWLGRPVCRRGGVLFIAAEGAYDLPRRLAGLVKTKIEPQAKQSTLIDPQRLPIAWKSKCPPLLSKDALPELIKIATEAQIQFKVRFSRAGVDRIRYDGGGSRLEGRERQRGGAAGDDRITSAEYDGRGVCHRRRPLW